MEAYLAIVWCHLGAHAVSHWHYTLLFKVLVSATDMCSRERWLHLSTFCSVHSLISELFWFSSFVLSCLRAYPNDRADWWLLILIFDATILTKHLFARRAVNICVYHLFMGVTLMMTIFLLKFLWENYAVAPSRSRTLILDQGRTGHVLWIFIQPAVRAKTSLDNSLLLPLATVAAIDSLRALELCCSGDLLLPREVPPMLCSLLYRVRSDQGRTVDPFKLSYCTCVCLTSCLVLYLKLFLALLIWVKREIDGIRRGTAWIRPNLLRTAGQLGRFELESCLKGLDLVFHFLLRLSLFVPQGLWVQLELIA